MQINILANSLCFHFLICFHSVTLTTNILQGMSAYLSHITIDVYYYINNLIYKPNCTEYLKTKSTCFSFYDEHQTAFSFLGKCGVPLDPINMKATYFRQFIRLFIDYCNGATWRNRFIYIHCS